MGGTNDDSESGIRAFEFMSKSGFYCAIIFKTIKRYWKDTANNNDTRNAYKMMCHHIF